MDNLNKNILILFFLLLSTLCAEQILAKNSAGADHVVMPQPILPQDVVDDGVSVTLDFDNVDIRLFIKYMSELTGKNFVVDRNVQGNVTIVSPTTISVTEAYHVFESVLEVHGFTTVPTGAVVKVIPSAAARSKNVETLRMGRTHYPEDKVVTQLIPLTHTTPEDMKKVLTPLISKTSVVVAHTPSGMLIVTETLSNIQRLLAIIETLDVKNRNEQMVVLPLENADATSIAKIFQNLYQRTGTATSKSVAASMVTVVPYDRVNSLVVLASEEELVRVKEIIEMLDTPAKKGEGNINVYYLQNADAEELAKVLNALPTVSKEEKEKDNSGAISKDVQVMADAETNALVITASRDEYKVLEDVIKKLDIPRQMVYLEALILEVNTSKQFDVGVEWAGGGTFSDGDGILVSGFSDNAETPHSRLSGINAESPLLPDGFSLGVLKQGIQIGDIVFPNLAAMLRAYENDSDINIIATPQLLTTDNKEAEISVGENVPYITSQNTTASEQDYTQYEYKDVATKLAITPQINQANTMRLDIETEVIKLKGTSLELTPTTYKRLAKTSVILNDNDTVVIGGIIGTDTTLSEIKVPLLGDIPLLGWLFKSRSTQTNKTNMFIFITPKIIRNPADISDVTQEKEVAIDNALPDVKKEIDQTINRNRATVLIEKGYRKLQQQKYVEAEEYFYEALQNDPQNPYAFMNLAVSSELVGDPEKALVYYQKVISTKTKARAIRATDNSEVGERLSKIAKKATKRIQRELENSLIPVSE